MNPCRIIAVANQKGGVGKTTTAFNLGTGLARQGKKVLLVDGDGQANLTQIAGWKNPDNIPYSLYDLMKSTLRKEYFNSADAVLQHDEGVDLIPSSLNMLTFEVNLFSMPIGRERVLDKALEDFKREYDYIIIDCSPNLSMMTINALVCANSVIIPVQTQYLSTVGLQQLSLTIGDIRQNANRNLQVEGILLTMCEPTNISKGVIEYVNDCYNKQYHIFEAKIPKSVKAVEAGIEGESVHKYDSKNPVSIAYESLAKEVVENERRRQAQRENEDRNSR